jgi:TldD protein
MKELSEYNDEKKLGAFIRVKAKDKWLYSSTTDLDNLEAELHNLLDAAGISTKRDATKEVEENEKIIAMVHEDFAFKLPKEEKIAFLGKTREVLENDPLVVAPYICWLDKVIRKWYANSKGIVYYYDIAFSSVLASYNLKEGENVYNTHYYKCFQYNDEYEAFFDKFMEDFKEAKLFINAPTIKPGKYITVLSPQATGIFAHESFGHKSEADFMLGDEAMLTEWEIGKKVASSIVSIVDEGGFHNNTGYCPFDDEGNETQKTYLIKDGILTGRLHSTETADILKEEITGNARSINFENEPIVRMTNTYFEKGDLSFDELIAPIKEGYFIKKVTHGSGMSTFTMASNRAYKIENGKLTDPVKINIITGTVFQTLHDIDGMTDEVEIISGITGGCGKGSQWPLQVGFGGPYLRVKELNLS